VKTAIIFLMFFSTSAIFSQEKLVLTPNGFAPVEFQKPNNTNEKLIEAAKAWADSYNRGEHDVYDVTENSLNIDALRENAFFYRNVGETYNYRIRYTLNVEFVEQLCRITFTVKDIYARRTLTKMTVGDFFAPDGRLKEDYEEVKPSLEHTANTIVNSFISFISR
jgi:hypothetical protein